MPRYRIRHAGSGLAPPGFSGVLGAAPQAKDERGRQVESVGLARAFAGTCYRVTTPAGAVTLVPGRRCSALDRQLAAGEALVLLTAWNPRGRIAAPVVNRIRQRRLEGLLHRRGFAFWPAVNAPGDPAWEEPSLAVTTRRPTELALLARCFEQAAVLVLRRGRPAKVVMLGPRRAGNTFSP
mgnify:CR=1 FL=1